MAAGSTPRLGSGPFDVCPNCQHSDCRANRELIASVCRCCHQPLGERARFSFVPWHAPAWRVRTQPGALGGTPGEPCEHPGG